MSSPRAEARVTWVMLLIALGAAAWLVLRAKPTSPSVPAAPSLLSLVPAGPALLVTVDVEALGEAAAVELLRAGGSALLGLRKQCGFEPLLGLRQVALSLPWTEADQTPDFALIARTALDPEPVLRCAEAVIRARGGVPVRSALGDFRSVRDQKKPLGEVAMRGDGVFVMSGGQYFRDVVDSAGGRFVADSPSKLRSETHALLRRELMPAQLVVTMLAGPEFALPGVRSLSAALRVGDDLELRGYVHCDAAAPCRQTLFLLEKLRAELVSEPGLASLRELRVAAHDATLEVSARLPREQLGPLVTQLLAP